MVCGRFTPLVADNLLLLLLLLPPLPWPLLLRRPNTRRGATTTQRPPGHCCSSAPLARVWAGGEGSCCGWHAACSSTSHGDGRRTRRGGDADA
jgi:hypothetical protein